MQFPSSSWVRLYLMNGKKLWFWSHPSVKFKWYISLISKPNGMLNTIWNDPYFSMMYPYFSSENFHMVQEVCKCVKIALKQKIWIIKHANWFLNEWDKVIWIWKMGVTKIIPKTVSWNIFTAMWLLSWRSRYLIMILVKNNNGILTIMAFWWKPYKTIPLHYKTYNYATNCINAYKV